VLVSLGQRRPKVSAVPGLRQATCAAPHNFSLGGYAQAIANGAGGGSRPPLLAGVPLGEGTALVPSPRCSAPSGRVALRATRNPIVVR